MLRLISLLMVDALRASIVAIARMPVPLPISIRMTCFLFRQVRIHRSHRCNILPDWFSGQLPIYRVLHFHLDNGGKEHAALFCYGQCIPVTGSVFLSKNDIFWRLFHYQ